MASALLLGFLTSVFGIVFSLADRRDAIDFQTAPYTIGPPVLDVICSDLQNALLEPFEDLDAFKAEGDSMGGADTTKIDFVTAVPSRSKVRIDNAWVRSAICEVGYRMRRSETADGLFALYRREDFGVDDKPLEGGKFYKLCDRVAEFRIDFFDDDPGSPESDEAEGELEWDAEREKGLPFGCRVTLVVMPPVDVDDRGDASVDSSEVCCWPVMFHCVAHTVPWQVWRERVPMVAPNRKAVSLVTNDSAIAATIT